MRRTSSANSANVTEIRSLARSYTRSALVTLASIMTSENVAPKVRAAAANSLLDRGWGRTAQAIAGDNANPLRLHFTEIVRTIVDPNPFAAIDAKVVEAGNSRLLPTADADTDPD